MAKSSIKVKRLPRKCVFCDNNANSKEHFWPGWLHPIVAPEPSSEKHDRPIHSYHPSKGHTVQGPRAKPGGLETIKIRAVCNDCNSGWMNQLEGDVRPILTPLVNGDQIKLNEDEQQTLAKWAALKCIVVEHDKLDVAVTPLQDRLAFKNDGIIPEYFRIYVANHITGRSLGFIRRTHCIALSSEGPSPPLDGVAQNIQTISFLVGRVLIHLNAARIDDFDFEQKMQIQSVWDACRIWPIASATMAYPRRPRLGDEALYLIGSCLERYIKASKVTWGPIEI